MMQAIVATTIEQFGRDEWNRLFPGELEDFSYYLAVERAALPGFEFLYFAVRENDLLRAVVPAFVTDYRLDTTLQGALRKFSDRITRFFPRLLRQRLLSLGSPTSETCHLGFDPKCGPQQQSRLLEALLTAAEDCAAQHRVNMIAAKDAAQAQDALWRRAAGTHKLRRQPGLPTACLDIRFASLDEYLASLSAATRKDMRRKLKVSKDLRVEWRRDIAGIEDQIMALYRATFANADFQFEQLSADYFTGVLRESAGRALCATYWLGERMVAFNLVLHDRDRLLDKFLGMDYAVARKYNLYFYTWMQNVQFCIEHGIAVYQSGQGLHGEKRRLGSRLSANWLWYRHRNRLLDGAFALVERIARLDRFDPELAALNPPELNMPVAKRWFDPARRRAMLAWAALLSCEMTCQLSLKYASVQIGAFDGSPHAFGIALSTPWLWAAIITYIGQFLVWMTILRKSTLSGAFPTSALLIVGVMLASALLFAEPIGWLKILGATIIIAGIALLGDDEKTSPTTPPELSRR